MARNAGGENVRSGWSIRPTLSTLSAASLLTIETMANESTKANSNDPFDSRSLGVLLAAGAGTRFAGEQHKLRAIVGNKAVLSHSLDAVLDAGFDAVAVVVGDDDFADLIPEGVHVIASPNWADGQSQSVHAAATFAAENGFSSMVIGVADQPLVGARTWAGVRSATDTPLAVATFGAKRRPPARLDSSVWSELPQTGDAGARELIAASLDRVTEVPSAGDPTDVDTIESLGDVRQRYADRLVVRELLGREPMGAFEVVARDGDGRPVVLKNHPVLVDGRPMPTLYWLCGERESMLVGRLEAMKGVRRSEADVGLDAVNATHDRYRAERDAILATIATTPTHVPTGGVGGTRNGVKCLHAHYGYHLAGGDDPVGQWVADHLHEVDSASWPSKR